MRKDIVFDVFLCHNSRDKPQVIEIAHVLKQMGLRPWLDIWEMPPGVSWQKVLEQQIPNIRSVAVFVGHQGLGPWQEQELAAFLREFVRRGCRVIPVLLKDAPGEPGLPLFLHSMTWVDFRQNYPHPMSQLVWGITGEKPQLQPKTVQPTSTSSTPSINLRIDRQPHQIRSQRLSEKASIQPADASHFQSTRSLSYLLQKIGIFQFFVIVVWAVIGYILGESTSIRVLLSDVLMAGSIGGAVSGLLFGMAWQSLISQAQPEETFIKLPIIGLFSGMLVWLMIYYSLTPGQVNQHSLFLCVATGSAFVVVFLGYFLNKQH